ncbi:MAG: metalloregulator ArsR/SmtB family transcription factor [Actinobacteria bacterium]|nr:metalloregulator ArsR/SmtB family transcription factor [Actinomycetota bacterium]MCL6105415.1 metalloregulator ArsR/SmtB family transcription factor [Actinomycetota bacterium]
MSLHLGRAPIVEQVPTLLPDDELLARLFRALGDASRLKILYLLLSEGELHQTEIVRIVGLSQGRVSEHLSCLVWCGFVSSRIENRRTYYRVTDPAVAQLTKLASSFLDRNEATIACCRYIKDT